MSDTVVGPDGIPVLVPPPRGDEVASDGIGTGPSTHSGHKIDEFIRCPRAFAYRYQLGVTGRGAIGPPVDEAPIVMSEPLVKGSLGHAGLARHYRRLQAVQEGDDPNKWLTPEDAIREMAEQREGNYPEFVELAIETVYNHIRYYDRERVHVLGVETELPTDRVHGWPHTRSADLIFRGRDGKVYVYDHKFVGRVTKRTTKRYELSGQFLDYNLMGRAIWGQQFGGVFLNVIEWSALGDPIEGKKFQRMPVACGAHALSLRAAQLDRAYTELSRLQREGLDPWTWEARLGEKVCNTSYGLCHGYDLCLHGKAAAPGHSRLAVVAG